MRSQNFLLHTEAKYPTYCPPVLGGRGYGREGIFFYPQVTSLWSVTQRLSIIGRLQRPNKSLNPTPSHPCDILHTPCSLFPTPCSLLLIPCSLLLAPYSLFPTPYSLLPAPCSLFNRKGNKNISYITTFFKKIGFYPPPLSHNTKKRT